MALTMLHYYFFKSTIDDLPNNIKNKLEYDNDLLFNLSTFNDLGIYYKILNPIKKDKYKLNELLTSDLFYDFIIDCINICKTNNNHKQLLFILAMISNNVLIKHINPFLSVRLTKKIKYDTACNMVDYYYSKANDLDLTKTSLADYFKTGFIYHNFMNDLISKPFVKIFKSFCTKEYFSHSIKRKRQFYTYCTRSKTRLKLIPYKLYDIFLNHRGKPKAACYLYSAKIDTSLFNLGNKPYLVGDETYSYSIDDIVENAHKELKDYYDAIIQYISYDNDKLLPKLKNIINKE